eukprot:TRINITY_DN249_c0_g1_i1.p1 TRINITY_DN249_c0_g1~~TRINITY_DN249_c0_g1_i1.p1  ORF type:complete len:619 (+),score=69.68 TRINITY_DN249_c0_g1_i1:222-2078(+)
MTLINTNQGDQSESTPLIPFTHSQKGKFRRKATKYVRSFFPMIDWIPTYKCQYLRSDVIAGLTVGATLLPQGMSYSLVAGLPPIYGLYSSFIPLIIYAFFGTSPHLSIGPFAVISLLVKQSIDSVLPGNTEPMKAVQVAITMCFMTGILQILLGIFRFGFISKFLSTPVRNGFNSASAIIIMISQLQYIFGVKIQSTNYEWYALYEILTQIKQTNLWTLLFSIASVLVLLAFKKINQRLKVIQVPGPLVMMILSTVLSYTLDLNGKLGIQLVGVVPKGLPTPSMPILTIDTITKLLPPTIVLTFVSFVSSVAIAQKFGEKFGYSIKPNQELVAFGLAQLTGSFFGAFPISSSLSRTAVNVEAGSATNLSSIFNSLVIVMSLLFLTKAIYFLPLFALASVVIVAVYNLIEVPYLVKLWKSNHHFDFLIMLTAFVGTLGVSILFGLLCGMCLSILLTIYKLSFPPFSELGKNSHNEFLKIDINTTEAKLLRRCLLIDVGVPLFYGNVLELKKKVCKLEKNRNSVSVDDGAQGISFVILDFNQVFFVDATVTNTFRELTNDFHKRGVSLLLCDVQESVRTILQKEGLLQNGRTFSTLKEAVNFAQISLSDSNNGNLNVQHC